MVLFFVCSKVVFRVQNAIWRQHLRSPTDESVYAHELQVFLNLYFMLSDTRSIDALLFSVAYKKRNQTGGDDLVVEKLLL